MKTKLTKEFLDKIIIAHFGTPSQMELNHKSATVEIYDLDDLLPIEESKIIVKAGEYLVRYVFLSLVGLYLDSEGKEEITIDDALDAVLETAEDYIDKDTIDELITVFKFMFNRLYSYNYSTVLDGIARMLKNKYKLIGVIFEGERGTMSLVYGKIN